MNRAVALLLAALLALPCHLVARTAFAQPAGRSARAAQALSQARAALRSLSRPAKVAIAGLVTAGTLATGLSFHHESAREGHIPIAFSEVSNVEREAAAQGVELPALQVYLMHGNETFMKVFEASNLAHEKLRLGSFANKLAQELDIKLQLDEHHYKLPGLFKEMPGLASAARRELGLEEATVALAPVRRDLDASWKHTWVDHSHMEDHGHTVTDYDSKGNATGSHWESNWVSVYDDTDHTYRYARPAGEAASAGLDNTLASHAVKRMALRTTTKTHADGELAADKSRGMGVNGKERLSKAQLLEIANIWAKGSTYSENIPRLEQLWNQVLRQDADTWRADKAKARDHVYNNTHPGSTDPGPKEYRTVEQALAHSGEFVAKAQEIVEPIRFTQANIPVLEAKIHQLVEKELHNRGVGDSKQLAKEIMSLSRQMYALNFRGGIDSKEFRAGMVFLWLLIGAAAGGAAGFGAGVGFDSLSRRRRPE